MKLKIKLRKIDFIFFLMCVFMVRPYYVQISVFNDIWAYITMIMFVISLVLIVNNGLIKNVLIVYGFSSVYLFATIINEKTNLPSAISTVGQMLLAYNIGILAFKYKELILRCIRLVISIYLYIDVFCGLLDISVKLLDLDKTMTFFGYDNYAAFTVLGMISIKWALDAHLYGRLKARDWICWFFCLVYKIITWSYTAFVILFLFALFYIVVNNFRLIRKFISVKAVIILIVFLLIGVSVYNIQDIFVNLLEDLGKGVTLNSRTVIWAATLSVLKNIPLLGYGYLSAGRFQEIIGLPSFYVQATHAHNIILDLLVNTGAVGLVFFFLILWINVKDIKDIDYRKNVQILLIGLICYLLMGFFDAYPFLSIFYLLVSLLGCQVNRYTVGKAN